MMKRILYLFGLLIILSALYANAQTVGTALNSRSLLLKSASNKKLVETARDHQWSIQQWSVNYPRMNEDTVRIIAIRVEFEADTSSLTTGNGRFGMGGDLKERRFYEQDTVYRFDKVTRTNSRQYFAGQLAALKNYYDKVSRGSLTLEFDIHPSNAGNDNDGYRVPHPITYYSPGWKRKREKTDEYWDRKTHGLIMFVRDALKAADGANSPFTNLYRDKDGILRLREAGRDSLSDRKAAILVLHAGASYLTDGGTGGTADSPSDMIDAFINQDYFKYFRDTLKLDTLKNAAGVAVKGHGGSLLIDEVMMCSETSNQDGLNWGIQGILVNQVARQLGIPDLFSTSSGVSAVGAFCIMDFAGYSAGQGFIPPYPSAWVRAFMGWDRPRVAGAGDNHNVKALASVLDRNNPQLNDNDTTILLIPINNNEYYLVENRQRNLSGDRSLFKYEDNNSNIISAYPFNANIAGSVKEMSGEANVILKTGNNDISLPASGVLVWHVDERIIRQRMPYNFVNADSAYRGVRLVEADGVNDLGVTFKDAFYQAAFDYGGAEDVFPHTKKGTTVKGFGPYTRPSTRANDGGHTYLDIKFDWPSAAPRSELSLNFQGDTVTNYSEEKFIVGVDRIHANATGWPRRAAPDTLGFYDPLITTIAGETVMALLGKSGKLHLFSINKNETYGSDSIPIVVIDYHGKLVDVANVYVKYFDNISGTFTFPSAINNRIYIPSSYQNQYVIYVYNSTNVNDKRVIDLPVSPSSYVCGIGGNRWALGLSDGRIIIGSDNNVDSTIQLDTKSPIRAIAVLKDSDSVRTFAAIQNDSTLSVIKSGQPTVSKKLKLGIPPFTLATGDLDNDGKSEIVISDSKQGVWIYTRELSLAPEWEKRWGNDPCDWANAYYVDPNDKKLIDRNRYPENLSAPALADIDRNGDLDIIVSGTNGIYAINRKGALLSKWPAYLDNRYWYQRGSVTTSPIVVSEGKNQPLVLFSSPTGENATFGITKIITANKARGVVTFRGDNGKLDSLWDLSAATIDTILTIGDSLIYPYILPGGFIDALNANAARPVSRMSGWTVPQSNWPISMGAPAAASPIVYSATANSIPSLFAAASDGMVYRWELTEILSDSLYWPQTGFDAARSFAYGGPPLAKDKERNTPKEPITFWNYPNPTSKDDPYTTFKYQFSDKAANVRLDIHTITGYKMDTFKNLSGDFPGWNEFRVNLRKYGPGIYRCRMEATVSGKKYSKMWKMAVVK